MHEHMYTYTYIIVLPDACALRMMFAHHSHHTLACMLEFGFVHVNALMQKCRTRPRCSIHSRAQFVSAPLHRRHLDKKHVMGATQEHEIYTHKGCAMKLVISGPTGAILAQTVLAQCLEHCSTELTNLLCGMLDKALALNVSKINKAQASAMGPAGATAIPEPANTDAPTTPDSTKGPLLDPQLPARELPCPGQTPHGISADVLRRAYEAGTHARRKLADPSLAVPKTPEPEKKLRNSWIVVLRGQESEGHSFGVYHAKWTRDKCDHCRLLKGLDWTSHIFGPGTHTPFPESIFHGFPSKEEVQAYLAGAGFLDTDIPWLCKGKGGI